MTVIAAPKPHFPDVKPWPAGDAADNPRAVVGGNLPPLDMLIVDMFDEAIDGRDGLRQRIADIVVRGADPKPCDSEDLAGRYGDFIKMVANVEAIVDQTRTTIKAPYLEATRALDGKARGITDALAAAKRNVKVQLDAFVRAQAEKVAAERRRIDAEQMRLREEAEARRMADEAAGRAVAEPEPEAPVARAEPAAPVARGDLGSRVGTKTVWRHKVDSVRQLPNPILNHPTVVEAIGRVVAGQIRGGIREIKGCTIWSEQESSVR